MGIVMPSLNSTKTPKPTKTSDYLIGVKFGREDGTVGIWDTSSCSMGNHPEIHNETSCFIGYKTAYAATCIHGKWGCGDFKPTTVK
jgi:hypothetical protein